MSRKHYQAIADAIAACKLPGYSKTAEAANATRRTIARELASILKQESSSFDRDRFLAACDMGDAS